MSTEILTVVVSTALIAGLFTLTIVELYRRRLATAALAAFATCATAHIVLVMSAWKGGGGRVLGRTDDGIGGVAANLVASHGGVRRHRLGGCRLFDDERRVRSRRMAAQEGCRKGDGGIPYEHLRSQ